MLRWLEYLIRAWTIGSVIPSVPAIISLFSVRPRESVTVTKYDYLSFSNFLVLKNYPFILNQSNFALALFLFEMKGFTVFQNFLLSVFLIRFMCNINTVNSSNGLICGCLTLYEVNSAPSNFPTHKD